MKGGRSERRGRAERGEGMEVDRETGGEIPSTKFQIPRKSQIPSSKSEV
jgi:hypothetical protein